MFADLTNFTRAAERADPETIYLTIRRALERLAQPVKRLGGRVDRYVGDGFLATFGLPESNEDDSIRAVLAALEMQASMPALREDASQSLGWDVQLRVGINSGSVISGLLNTGSLLGDTFRVAFERRETFDSARDSAAPWLYGIAANLLRRHRRSEARRLRATSRLAGVGGGDVPDEDRVIDAADAAALLPAVADVVVGLPEEEREVLQLFAWEGLSYDDIAVALDVPVGTVRSRLNRARRKVRELMPEEATATIPVTAGTGTLSNANTASPLFTPASVTTLRVVTATVIVSDSVASISDSVDIVVSPAQGGVPGLVGHWAFDETSGGTTAASRMAVATNTRG